MKGTHAAVDRYTAFSRKNRYVLKCDLRKFFPSIDHEILLDLLARKSDCRQTMDLLRLIVESSNPQEPVGAYFPGDDLFTPHERRHGIPIGNLTSQFFANVYLNPFDHFVKEELGCGCYIRYCDDCVIFGDDKRRLGRRWNGWRIGCPPYGCACTSASARCGGWMRAWTSWGTGSGRRTGGCGGAAYCGSSAAGGGCGRHGGQGACRSLTFAPRLPVGWDTRSTQTVGA